MCYYNSRQPGLLQITTEGVITNYDSVVITIYDRCYNLRRLLLQFTTGINSRQNRVCLIVLFSLGGGWGATSFPGLSPTRPTEWVGRVEKGRAGREPWERGWGGGAFSKLADSR